MINTEIKKNYLKIVRWFSGLSLHLNTRTLKRNHLLFCIYVCSIYILYRNPNESIQYIKHIRYEGTFL